MYDRDSACVQGGWLTFVMMMESQTELFSSALTVGALQISSWKIVQFDFLH